MKTPEFFMARAIELAAKGFPLATPNPLVGCVLVKNGKIIAENFHKKFGGPHAEIEALRQAGARAKNAAAFINLEPCSYWGKTPPCTEALIKSRVKKVFVAALDPNPKVHGRGIEALRAAGIEVHLGTLARQTEELNLPFWTQMAKNRPYIVLKAATSLDGKTTDYQHKSRWITSRESRETLWKIRSLFDAVLVGIGTVRSDNPQLTSHGHGRNPIRVVIDPRLTINPRARILNTSDAPTILATSTFNSRTFKILSLKNVEILMVPQKKKELDVGKLLKLLSLKGIQTLLVEGGGITHSHFTERRLFDEILWFMAPKILGGEKAKTTVEGRGFTIAKALTLRDLSAVKLNNELVIRGFSRKNDLKWPLLDSVFNA